MALNVAQLRNQIQAVFNQRLPDSFSIASRISRAYYIYAVAAQAPPGSPVVLKGSEPRMMEVELLRIMNSRLQGTQAAQALGRAVTAFWLTPPVMTAAGGAVTAIVVSPAVAKLSYSDSRDSMEAAMQLSQSLDMMTRTVFVTSPPPLASGVLF